MVGTHLSKEMIEAGVALIRRLDESGLSPCAAFWIYSSEANDWKLKIADAKVGKEGPRKAYGKIHDILLEHPDEFNELSLGGISGIRYKDAAVDGVFIDDAYIYRAQ